MDFTGRRVGVIGTGSSAIQSIPIIAKQASHLYVFQRTPNFSMPAQNAPLDPEYERRVKAGYADFRRQARESRVGFVTERSGDSALAVPAEEREREYEKRWRRGGLGFSAAYTDLLVSKEANDTAAQFFREKIRAIVRDPAVADLLCPQSYPLGTKRLCVDTGYYDTFNRDNVTLVDVQQDPDRGHHPEGRAGGRRRVRGGRSRLRHRLRRDDRRAAQHRHPRARRPQARHGVGGRPAHLSRPDRRRASRTCS